MIESEPKKEVAPAEANETEYLQAVEMLTSPPEGNFEAGLRAFANFGVTKLAPER